VLSAEVKSRRSLGLLFTSALSTQHSALPRHYSSNM
jgi:hypothetical protein